MRQRHNRRRLPELREIMRNRLQAMGAESPETQTLLVTCVMLVILAFEAMVPRDWLDEALTSEPEMFEILREDFGDVIDELRAELLFWLNLYENNAAAPIHPAQMESYLQSLLAMCGREFCHCSLMLLSEPASWLPPRQPFHEGMDEPHDHD